MARTSAPLTVCLVSQEYPPETARGGIGTQTWNKAQELTKRGHTVHVVSSTAGRASIEVQSEMRAGVTVHRLRPPGQEFPVNEPATYWLGYSWAVFRYLRTLTEQVRFDLVNFPEYGAEGFAFQLDRTQWNWVPIIVQLHGPLSMFTERIGWPEPQSEFSRVGTFMERVSIQNADWLMASSANIADFSAQFYDVPRDRIDVVHCGVDPELFKPAPERAVSSEGPTVLFVGNLAANKGVGVVFEAVLRLHARYPNIRLQLLGKADDDLMETFRRRAEAVGAGRNIEFVGFVGDRASLPGYYQKADVFCSPAHHEVGVANVYVEAMACGCPVVACLTGGAPEAVTDGESGFLVRPGDVEATTAVMDKILSQPDLRLMMGRAGRRRVEQYFATDKYIARVLAAYEKALGRSGERLAALGLRGV